MGMCESKLHLNLKLGATCCNEMTKQIWPKMITNIIKSDK